MKKMDPHISSKRGSMLMLTLIVFMVILILGMTMITSMLYSQGENTMQINEQKAYYAAFSAVEAVKAYFLNPKLDSSVNQSITSPHELVGGKYTYNLREQGIDEDTTVNLSIERCEEDAQYILIKATGICNGEKSVVTAKMREEEQKGSSGGLYSSHTVLACNRFTRNRTDRGYLNIRGNIFVDDAGMQTSSTIESVDLTEEQGGSLFIRSEGSGPNLQHNKLRDVFWQSKSNQWININDNEQIENIYFQELPGSAGNINFHRNTVRGQVQFLMNNKYPKIYLYNNKIEIEYENKIGIRYTLSVPPGSEFALHNNKVDYIYIHGAKKIPKIEGSESDYIIKELHTDAIDYGEQSYVAQIIQEDLSSYISKCEQHIMDVMKDLDQLSEVLKNKPEWTRPDESSGFIKIQEGVGNYPQDPVNSYFEEYYDPYRKIRLVFSDNYYYFKIRKEAVGNKASDTYIISDEYADDQIFFIVQNALGVDFYTSSKDKFEALYVYAPNATCQFHNDFEYLKGSIIAKNIYINNVQGKLIFREPEKIEGIGMPGEAESTGSSSSTTYTYHFEEYIESDKNQS
ncbi:MAG: hypothetical protein H9893_03150 [Candidatus Niameybacter stercoravium]|nr:hypothetical protein [Candidatus Niameybacter stercoravium]